MGYSGFFVWFGFEIKECLVITCLIRKKKKETLSHLTEPTRVIDGFRHSWI